MFIFYTVCIVVHWLLLLFNVSVYVFHPIIFGILLWFIYFLDLLSSKCVFWFFVFIFYLKRVKCRKKRNWVSNWHFRYMLSPMWIGPQCEIGYSNTKKKPSPPATNKIINLFLLLFFKPNEQKNKIQNHFNMKTLSKFDRYNLNCICILYKMY